MVLNPILLGGVWFIIHRYSVFHTFIWRGWVGGLSQMKLTSFEKNCHILRRSLTRREYFTHSTYLYFLRTEFSVCRFCLTRLLMGESEFSDDEDVDGTTLSSFSSVKFVLLCVNSIRLSFEITPSVGDMPVSDTLSFDSFVVLRRNSFLTNDIPTIDAPNPRKTITILV